MEETVKIIATIPTFVWLYFEFLQMKLYMNILSRLDARYKFLAFYDRSSLFMTKHMILFFIPWFQHFNQYSANSNYTNTLPLIKRRNNLVIPTWVAFVLSNVFIALITLF